MKVHVFSITIHTFIVITDISKLVNLHKMQSLTSTPSIDFFTYFIETVCELIYTNSI